MKMLLIEDDPEIVESISLALQIRWPETRLVSTHLGQQGIELAGCEDLDLVIIDLGLPDISGFEVLKQIRLLSSVPIIILTAKTDEAAIVKGLEWGADDYIVKPCGQLELLARINVRIRDKDLPAGEPPLSFGPMRFDPSTRHLLCGDKEVHLTAIESHIIQRLIKNAGRVAAYSVLAEQIWGEDYPGSIESLRVHVRRLREKIEADPGHPRLILTRAGAGYLLAKPDVT
ncbi:MAG: response regulator transcription factor [Dehalococcoidia bacterium]